MGKKKDDIEFEIQEAVVEEEAEQKVLSEADQTTPNPSYSGGEKAQKGDTTLKDEAEEMKEQARNPRSRSAKLRIGEKVKVNSEK